MKKSKEQTHHFRAIHLLILILALSFLSGTAMAKMGSGGGGRAIDSAVGSGGGGGGGGNGPGAGGGGEPTAVNNLSFPAIAIDNFTVFSPSTFGFTVPYTGEYPGLTAEAITFLEANGPWYPQKTVGNGWQAESRAQSTESVTFVDWGDNIESVNPKVRTPFRIEVTLYKDVENSTGTMNGYLMEVLEYPSSLNELQGTNAQPYPSPYATVVSAMPKMVIQYLGSGVPEDMTWNGTEWTSSVPLTSEPVSFGPELNVGGKYVFGASLGGWRPSQTGYYRLTFYIPSESGIDLRGAQIGNYATNFTESTEGAAATPVVDSDNNLTYVDVLVQSGGGQGGGKK